MYKSYKKQVLSSIENANKASLESIGLAIQAESVKKMTEFGVYTAGDIVDTGRLRASIKHEVISKDMVQIGTNVEYADYVFLGTYKMRARNAILDATVDNKEKIQAIMKNAYERWVK